MEEPMIRGHLLEHTARFYRSVYDHTSGARIDGELSIELKGVLDSLTRADWYPRRYFVELLNAFATVRGASDATYGEFLQCGRSLATANTEFAKLLMALMTPDMFVKKLPRFWSRDHKSSGAFELEPIAGSSEQVARVTLRSVMHYDHGAIFWLGFMQGVLGQLGTSKSTVTQQGWSWGSPGPQDVVYEMRWS